MKYYPTPQKIRFIFLLLALSAISFAFATFEDFSSVRVIKYYVDKSETNWKVSCEQRVKVRIHTSRIWAIHIETYCSPSHPIIIKPNQWMEMHIYQREKGWIWTVASDADHR